MEIRFTCDLGASRDTHNFVNFMNAWSLFLMPSCECCGMTLHTNYIDLHCYTMNNIYVLDTWSSSSVFYLQCLQVGFVGEKKMLSGNPYRNCCIPRIHYGELVNDIQKCWRQLFLMNYAVFHHYYCYDCLIIVLSSALQCVSYWFAKTNAWNATLGEHS